MNRRFREVARRFSWLMSVRQLIPRTCARHLPNRSDGERDYGSHLPALAALFEVYELPVCLEFGMGFRSTPFLLQKGGIVVSVEHSPEWFRKVLKHTRKLGGLHFPVLWESADVASFVDKAGVWRYNLVLVDGPVASRVPCVSRCLGRADVLVLHDTEASCYRWNEAFAQIGTSGMTHVTLRDKIPWTTIVARDDGRFDRLLTRLGVSAAEKGQVYPPVRRY